MGNRIRVHLWKDSSKQVDLGICSFDLDSLQCNNNSCKKCNKTLKELIKCELLFDEYFEIEGTIKEEYNANK